MRSALLAFAMFTLLALPARAAVDIEAQKEAMMLNHKQETIALGGNRFLIISGSPDEGDQFGYTIDLVKLNNGVPRFDPLYMEDYDPETNRHTLSAGAAFFAYNYHFDKSTDTLDYTSKSNDGSMRIEYRFKLQGDTLAVKQVTSQVVVPCTKEPCKKPMPSILFEAKE